MYKIGLTGGIATGKSTVVKMLRTYGAAIIDCDVLAREAVAPGSPGLARVAAVFGNEYVDETGALRREKLGKAVFAEAAKKQQLERILFPYIYEAIAVAVRQWEARGAAVAVLDMPLLFEVEYQKYVDEVWLVYVTPDIQLRRLMARNGYDRHTAETRIHAQLPIDDKKKAARVVIDNTGTLAATARQVAAQWRLLQVRTAMFGRSV